MICNDFGHKFSFNAKNIEDAKIKRNNFERYHSNYNQYTLEETEETKMLHNAYVDNL